MGYKIGELFWKIEADTTDFDKNAKKTETSGKNLGKSLTTVGKAVAVGFAAAIVAGTVKISKELITAASVAEETRNKFNVVFQDVSDAAQSSAENLAENFGLSRTAAQGLLSDTGDLLTGFGFTGEAALDLSTQVNELAVDLASFTNFSGGAEGASEALTKALLGERESVKALGISILDADVKAKVLEMTQQGLTFETERQAKAYATMQIALEQSGNAIGDFERSSDSYANQMRVARAATDDLKTAIGENLLPAATNIVSTFAEVTAGFANYVTAANEAKAASDNLLDTARGTGGDTSAAIVELENRIKSVRIAMDGSRGDLLKLARQYEFNTKNVEAYVRGLELDLEVRKQYQAVRDANTKAQEEEAQALLDTAEAQEAASTELQAYLDLVEGRYSETQQGMIDAKQAEIDLWTEYAETAVNTAPQIQAILEDLREEYDSLTETIEDVEEASDSANESFSTGLSDALALAMQRRQEYMDFLIAKDAEEAELNRLRLQSFGTLFGGIASLIDAFGANSKESFIAMKAFASAEAAINSALAFTQALTQVPFPFNIIAAGGVAAAGIAQQVKILSTPVPEFADGGIVPGTSFTGDNVPAKVNSGEMVLNKQQQAKLFDMANTGGSGGSTIILQLPNGKEFAKWTVDTLNSGQGGIIKARVIQ